MNNPYIRPEAVAVLGGAQNTVRENTAVRPVETQQESSLWGRIKSRAKQVCGYVKQGLQFVNTYVVPIVTVVTGFLSAWSKFQNSMNAEKTAA